MYFLPFPVQVYLSLPNYQSLTEGHCLITPMQHYTAATLLDEDIWEEIQVGKTTGLLQAGCISRAMFL